MNLFGKIKKGIQSFKSKWEENREARRLQKETERVLRNDEPPSRALETREAGSGTIDVSSVYRKGRGRRRDIRITQRRFRAERRALLLINRPGTYAEIKGERGYWSNKGRFISFATVKK